LVGEEDNLKERLGLFGKGFLVSLFKYRSNTYELKNSMKKHVVIFKY